MVKVCNFFLNKDVEILFVRLCLLIKSFSLSGERPRVSSSSRCSLSRSSERLPSSVLTTKKDTSSAQDIASPSGGIRQPSVHSPTPSVGDHSHLKSRPMTPTIYPGLHTLSLLLRPWHLPEKRRGTWHLPEKRRGTSFHQWT